MKALGLFLSLVYILLGSIHLYWIAGGKRGLAAALPSIPRASEGLQEKPAFQPGRTGTLVVALLLMFIAYIIATYSGVLNTVFSPHLLRLTIIGVALLMILRAIGDFRLIGFFKKIKGTAFSRMDSLLYSPLCLSLGIALIILAL